MWRFRGTPLPQTSDILPQTLDISLLCSGDWLLLIAGNCWCRPGQVLITWQHPIWPPPWFLLDGICGVDHSADRDLANLKGLLRWCSTLGGREHGAAACRRRGQQDRWCVALEDERLRSVWLLENGSGHKCLLEKIKGFVCLLGPQIWVSPLPG